MERAEIITILGPDLGGSFIEYITHGSESPAGRNEGRLRLARELVRTLQDGNARQKTRAIVALLLVVESVTLGAEIRLDGMSSDTKFE